MTEEPAELKRILIVGCGAPTVMHLPALIAHLRVSFDFEVAVALTAAGRRLVAPAAIAAVCARPPIPAQWAEDPNAGPLHVTWAKWPDLVVVWPATLHFLASCAAGLTADVASSIVLATEAPVILAPSISTGALKGGAYQRVRATLESDGHHLVGPEPGLSLSDLNPSDGGCVPPETLIHEIQRVWSATIRSRHAQGAQP
jgi:phosphopantothenoylcysteine synthetase/decarboxylase